MAETDPFAALDKVASGGDPFAALDSATVKEDPFSKLDSRLSESGPSASRLASRAIKGIAAGAEFIMAPALGVVKKVAPILEPLREPAVGLGGIAAGLKAEPGQRLSAASESIERRKGLGRELVEPFIKPGLGQELGTLAAEVATDPLTYASGTIASRMFKMLGRAAELRAQSANYKKMSAGLDASIEAILAEKQAAAADFNKAMEISGADRALEQSIGAEFDRRASQAAARAEAVKMTKTGSIHSAMDQAQLMKDEAYRELNAAQAAVQDHKKAYGFDPKTMSADPMSYKAVADERAALERAAGKAKAKAYNMQVWQDELISASGEERLGLQGKDVSDFRGKLEAGGDVPMTPKEIAEFSDPAGVKLDELKAIYKQVHDARKAGLSGAGALSDDQARILALKNAEPELAGIFDKAETLAMREALEGKTTAGQIAAEVKAPLSDVKAGTPPARAGGESLAIAVGRRVDYLSKKMQRVVAAAEGLNSNSKLAVEHIDAINKTGTLPEGARAAFRSTKPAGATESDIQKTLVSGNTVNALRQEMSSLVSEYNSLERQLAAQGDAASVNTSKIIGDSMRQIQSQLNLSVQKWKLSRFASNRAVSAFNNPFPVDVIATLKRNGEMLGMLKDVKERLPITTNIIESLKNMGRLAPAEKSQLLRDVINQFKLNLFSPLSFTLDFGTNAAEIVAQGAGHLGQDLVRVGKNGDASFSGISGLMKSLKRHASSVEKLGFHPEPPELSALLDDTTAGGESIRNSKWGTFTRRETPFSTAFDYLVGAPLYAKGMVDNASKRVAAMGYIYGEAGRRATAAGLSGLEKERFIDGFVKQMPDDVATKALEFANKAGFNRQLTRLEERYANSPMTTLFVDTFARWPLQFGRWGAEMLGYNPGVMSRGAPAVGEYLAKTATGYGGLYLVNSTLYDRVDFNTMEYVKPNGDRTRLSNRDPLTTSLFMLAVLHGDKDKAAAALQFASLPGAKIVSYSPSSGASSGAGGLLTGILNQFQQLAGSRSVNPRRVKDEIDSIVNRAIPGQALLGLIKTIIDPTVRQGIGAGIPGLSLAKKPVVDPTTGKPLVPRQRIPLIGAEVPSVLGTPFPGATRVLNPMEKLLFKYGMSVGRGVRTSLAGVPPNLVPNSMRDEWVTELGIQRQVLFRRMLTDPQEFERIFNSSTPDITRELVRSLDNAAAALATTEVERRHGVTIQRPVVDTRKKAAGPDEYKPFRR